MSSQITVIVSPKDQIRDLMKVWLVKAGNGKRLSLESFTIALNAVPGASTMTRQSVHLWNTGKALPLTDRAVRNLLVAPAGSWQKAFWRDVVEIVAPSDIVLDLPQAQVETEAVR